MRNGRTHLDLRTTERIGNSEERIGRNYRDAQYRPGKRGRLAWEDGKRFSNELDNFLEGKRLWNRVNDEVHAML